MTNYSDQRITHEIDHGKFLAEHGAGKIWNWESPAGRIRWKRRSGLLISHIKPEMKVLEIGCGTGYLTKKLAETGANIYAIDVSFDLLKIARSNTKSRHVKFFIANACKVCFGNNYFDSVVGSSVLHHLDVDLAFPEFYRVLKPGGSIYFTEPNMLNPHIFLEKNIPYFKKILGDSPDETAFYRWDLQKKIELKNFNAVKIEPFDFLHPWIPKVFIAFFQPVCFFLEKIPFVSEIAGSLFINAKKPL